MTRTRLVNRAAVVALIVSLAGCTGSDPTPTVTSVSSSSSVPTPSVSTPTPTSTPTSPEDEAVAGAEEVVPAYYRAVVECLTDPADTATTCFDDVATATELNNMRNALASAQQMQTKTSGSIEVVSMQVVKVDLSDDVKATPPLVPEVVFRVCADASGFDIVDANGKSIVPPDRIEHGYDQVTLLNYSYPDPTKWRVGLVDYAQEEAPC